MQYASDVLTSMQPLYHFLDEILLVVYLPQKVVFWSRVVISLPLQLKQLPISLNLNLIHREYPPQLTIALLHFKHNFSRFQPHLTSTSTSLYLNITSSDPH